MLIDRATAARLGHETVAILRAGHYAAPPGRIVDLRALLNASVTATIEYSADQTVALPAPGRISTRITIENATVLSVGHRMSAERPVAALNFAASTHPGGGFLTGARAQEESIARSSGLYAALAGRRMYAYHRSEHDPMHSGWVIVSPGVPVFRSDDGTLLEEPWQLTVLTSPALNLETINRIAPERLAEIPTVSAARVNKVLAVAARHGVRRFILGAWGCGAFGLAPPMMARAFRDALTGPFTGVFNEIVFAITDWSPERRFIGPFREAFPKTDPLDPARIAGDELPEGENQFGRRNIRNSSLTATMVPNDALSWPQVIDFALTFDAYSVSHERAGDIGNHILEAFSRGEALPADLTLLRTALFFEQRRYAHSGDVPVGEGRRYIDALLAAIRAAITKGS